MKAFVKEIRFARCDEPIVSPGSVPTVAGVTVIRVLRFKYDIVLE
jgi:hypothetical protein